MSSKTDFLKTCTPDVWFAWALEQFNVFERAPRPMRGGAVVRMDSPRAMDGGYSSTSAWADKFIAWLGTGAANQRTRTIGQFLLRSWNSEIDVAGADALERVYGGCDDVNRRGIRTVLEHVRYF